MLRLLLAVAGSLLLLVSCGTADDAGTRITVNLKDAAGLNANFDRIVLGGEKEMLRSTPIDDTGEFTFSYDGPLPAGLYQIRVGAQKLTFPLTGEGGNLKIVGELSTFSGYEVAVTGSEAAEELVRAMDRIQQATSIENVEEILSDVENPYSAAFLAFNTLLRSGEAGLSIQEKVVDRLPVGDPNRLSYTSFLDQVRQQIAQQEALARIKPGLPAPDLELPGPDGTVYRLSDLRGQVVLLDFWAAWCGPCRRENPNVVKVYDRYKDRGFTIFSVSLDGVRPNQAARMTAEQLAEATENQRQKWIAAIAQDNLSWPYHGSELKYWNGTATATYGVRAIPATFLIDREGKIAEVGLRGASSIERALQRVL